MKISIYYTAYLQNDWVNIISSHMQYLQNYNIFDKIEDMNVFYYPYDIRLFDIMKDSKIHFFEQRENMFEFPALRSICESKSDIVLYFHSKGSSLQQGSYRQKNAVNWGNLMLYIITSNFDKMCDMIYKGYVDCTGSMFKLTPKPHFSGNFFLTSMNHIDKINHYEFKDRSDAEWMIGSVPGRYMSFFDTNVDLYYKSIDPNSISIKQRLITLE